MALLEGKTAEVIAHEVITELGDVVMEFSSTTYNQIEKLARYINRTTIFNRGERAWSENRDAWMRQALEQVIDARHTQLEKQMDKAEKDAANEYFQLLVSRGMEVKEAFKLAFN